MLWIGRRGRGFGLWGSSRIGDEAVVVVELELVELGLMLRVGVARLGMALLGASLRILVVVEASFHRRVVAAITIALGDGARSTPVRCLRRAVEPMMSEGQVLVGAVEGEGEGGEVVVEVVVVVVIEEGGTQTWVVLILNLTLNGPTGYADFRVKHCQIIRWFNLLACYL